MPMLMEVLTRGVMARPPEPELRHTGLRCQMQRFVAGVNVAVVVYVEHPAPDLVVMETLAAGFSLQGQLIRPAVVAVGTPEQLAAAATSPAPGVADEPAVSAAVSHDMEELAEAAPATPEPTATLSEDDRMEPDPEPVSETSDGAPKPAGGQSTLF